MIRVLIADDQTLVRDGLRALVDLEDDMEVVAEANDGESAIMLARQWRPDVVLMDVRMPGVDGIESTRRIVTRGDAPKVLVLTMFNRDEYVFHALRAGASGFLLKDVRGGQLTRAIRAVAAGDSLVDPAITRRLIEERVTAERRPNPDRVPQIGTLTQRELDVLQRVARGLSNAEIAADLVVGEATVKTHVAHILAKLGVRDRVQAVVAAYEAGVVTVRAGD